MNLTRFSGPAANRRARAAALHDALAGATTPLLAWLDRDMPDVLVRAMTAALDDPTVAAVTLAEHGRTLTTLGVPIELPALAATARGPALYAPAGLAIFHRARVLSVGGIDATLVYGHEDANLGWRLALRGLKTVEISGQGLSLPTPSPVPTVDALTLATQLRHETANQLATLFVCAGDEWLRSALPAALARTICLAAADAGLTPDQFDFTANIPAEMALPTTTIARLLALDDLVRHFRALQARRAAVQAEREYTDDELRAQFFADPVDAQWEAVAGDSARALCRILGLEAPQSVVVPPLPPPLPHHDSPSASPPVSIIVLTALGPKYLPECLDSLAKLDYPPDAIEVIVVDNGSRDDPTDTVRRHYPRAHVVRNARNLGFCGGNNAGVAVASHDWLLFLNDDTRVDRGLLRGLFATSVRHSAAAVGAFVVDWSGTEVDFAGGGMSFDGNGFQEGIGSVKPSRWRQERPIPFANGAAMLVRRDAYFAAGGFPHRYFAYYEDVALGWALWMEGQQIWLSADALVYHRHHGTAKQSPSAARQRNCERNARFTILTHASAEALPDLLSAALLLAAERVVMAAGLGGMVDDPLAFVNDHRLSLVERLDPRLYMRQFRAEFRRQGAKREYGVLGSLTRVGVSGVLKSLAPLYVLARWGGTAAPPVGDRIAVKSEWAATLAGTAECCNNAAAMEPHRAALQAIRRHDEHQFASKFPGNWLDPVLIEPTRQGEYERAHRAIVKHFDLARFLR